MIDTDFEAEARKRISEKEKPKRYWLQMAGRGGRNSIIGNEKPFFILQVNNEPNLDKPKKRICKCYEAIHGDVKKCPIHGKI